MFHPNSIGSNFEKCDSKFTADASGANGVILHDGPCFALNIAADHASGTVELYDDNVVAAPAGGVKWGLLLTSVATNPFSSPVWKRFANGLKVKTTAAGRVNVAIVIMKKPKN